MHTGLQWKFIRYKQQTDDYYAFINVTSILHLYYIVMFCSVLKHINPRQMHVNANHVKFPFNGMPLYVNITSIIVYRLWRCWTVRLFMATSFTTKRKGKKNASLYVISLYSYNQNLNSNYMLLSHIQLSSSPYSVVLTFMFRKLEETPLTNPIGFFSKHFFFVNFDCL